MVMPGLRGAREMWSPLAHLVRLVRAMKGGAPDAESASSEDRPVLATVLEATKRGGVATVMLRVSSPTPDLDVPARLRRRDSSAEVLLVGRVTTVTGQTMTVEGLAGPTLPQPGETLLL